MINGQVHTIQDDLALSMRAITTDWSLRRLLGAEGLFYGVFKRLIDLLGAATLLILLAPVMLVVALAIRLDSSGPIIFRQTRVGKGHKPFTFLKFRSMYYKADCGVHQQFVKSLISGQAATYKMTGDKRITHVGAFIRKTSLDELPQLINVLRGDMSLVGPRPSIPYEVAEYKDWHHRRFDAMPGITGLWQVHGRSQVSFDEMVQMDIAYVEQRSLALDVSLLVQTIPAVLTGRGAR